MTVPHILEIDIIRPSIMSLWGAVREAYYADSGPHTHNIYFLFILGPNKSKDYDLNGQLGPKNKKNILWEVRNIQE